MLPAVGATYSQREKGEHRPMKALKYITEVDSGGRIKLPKLRLKRGTRVRVIILEHEENEMDLLKAAETTLGFWDNPMEDQVWNAA